MEKYEKIRVVGRGAYGTVYLCWRIADRKLLIIKQIPVEQMTKEERQAALNEVKVLAMLDHPNIIEYIENFLEDKALMIVMEYAQGGTLFEYLQQRNSQLLEEEEIFKYLAQMLLSLQHVHSKQILHRDLKTQNILMDKKRDVVKIGDFGISKVLSSKSKAYTVVGTPSYISPELCEGKPYNQKSDIWALGCVLYELASLRRAFEAQNLPALILKIMRGTFAPISDRYSNELRQLILSMLHLDPNKRPSINEIMAQPIILNALMHLYTDFGSAPCRRVPRSLSDLSGPSRGRVSRTGTALGKSTESIPTKLVPLSTVFCWGSGITTPVALPLPSSDVQVRQVAAGRTQKAAVTKNGRLFIWEVPTLSSEAAGIAGTVPGTSPAFVPRYLEGQSAVTIQHVACGDLFTACLTDRGILMTFGSGATGCLGHGNFKDVPQAKIVEALLGFEVIQVSCGASHVLAVTNDYEVFSWGRGDNGRLCLGSQESYCSPQEVMIPDNFQPNLVTCGIDCSMLLTLEGQLLCCGSNRYNKLAMDTDQSRVDEIWTFSNVQSPPLKDMTVKMVATGTSHAMAVGEAGECYTFGSNQFSQLGYNTEYKKDRFPQKLETLVVSTVACGDTFSVAVTKDCDVYTWGKCARGRLGRPMDTRLPKQVHFGGAYEPFTVTSISCSHGTTLLAAKPLPRGGSLRLHHDDR